MSSGKGGAPQEGIQKQKTSEPRHEWSEYMRIACLLYIVEDEWIRSSVNLGIVVYYCVIFLSIPKATSWSRGKITARPRFLQPVVYLPCGKSGGGIDIAAGGPLAWLSRKRYHILYSIHRILCRLFIVVATWLTIKANSEIWWFCKILLRSHGPQLWFNFGLSNGSIWTP